MKVGAHGIVKVHAVTGTASRTTNTSWAPTLMAKELRGTVVATLWHISVLFYVVLRSPVYLQVQRPQ